MLLEDKLFTNSIDKIILADLSEDKDLLTSTISISGLEVEGKEEGPKLLNG